jgi:hypothetical protein
MPLSLHVRATGQDERGTIPAGALTRDGLFVPNAQDEPGGTREVGRRQL